ncbi:hypothetical protein [Mesobacillus thioparans]|uniref:hypothetical protein n=1 Tax=Mesobacillus thioparans TaxID=370439 RepID=UPI0039EECF11
MNFEMQKTNLLAENIRGFSDFVQKCYREKSGLILNHDKLYQVRSWVEEYKFQSLAAELKRINMFEWDEKYTLLLVDRFRKGFSIIERYVENNSDDLFILTARMHTLKNCLNWFRHEHQPK